ncbi:hypothetical protein BDP55DRAFT_295381 [Colletotrichum godetiae]|uniref:Uncharacterized protein n=1 Tax=Colletotrichum godetiae TaxID=1209918 RepID=A0AAJ0AGU2_9PEZI|nr:uncharacterized protein BDP55DRAFT_295381 [Colletotrichum godetiae]KAK1671446.1 hypothetical protein BDP55DRAFT_295381 [Colletotrichum godetiae]
MTAFGGLTIGYHVLNGHFFFTIRRGVNMSYLSEDHGISSHTMMTLKKMWRFLPGLGGAKDRAGRDMAFNRNHTVQQT